MDKYKILIRPVKKNDLKPIMTIFESISDTERRFLAFDFKKKTIRSAIKNESGCLVATLSDTIIGFLMESKSDNGFYTLEELVVHPKYRGIGVSTKLLQYYHKLRKKTLAKSKPDNDKINKILHKNGYVINDNVDNSEVLHWVRHIVTGKLKIK